MTSQKSINYENYGVDIGSNKIVISQSAENSSSNIYCATPITIADMMDIRNIPNRVVLSSDNEQIRSFGNNAPFTKAFKLDPYDSLTVYKVTIGSQKYSLPGYIIKNMIMSHVKEIIQYRSELSSAKIAAITDEKIVPKLNRLVVAIDHTTDIKTRYFDIQAINCILSANTEDKNMGKFEVVPIRDDYAAIMSYLAKYILQTDAKTEIKKRNIMLVDMGYKKTSYIVFSVSRINGITNVTHITTTWSEKLSGKHFDDILAELLVSKAEKNHKTPIKELTADSKIVRSELTKIKHQLSSNLMVMATFQGADMDVSFSITRDEFEKALLEHDLWDVMKSSFDNAESNLYGQTLDHVEMIGGSSRIPLMRQLVKRCWNDKSMFQCMNQDESVSNGAAVYGWLLDNQKIAKNILFTRCVNPAVLKTHKRKDPIEIFEGSTITSYLDSTISEDSKMTELFSDEMHIFYGDSKKYDAFENIKIIMSFKNKKNIDSLHIVFRQNMADMIEIVDIKDSNGDFVGCDILVTCCDDKKESIDVAYNTYRDIEINILKAIKLTERRQNVGNFMESFFYDNKSVDSLIDSINKKEGFKQNETIKSVNDHQKNQLKTPIKEVYEFFHFCKVYTEDADDDMSKKKKSFIKKLLIAEKTLSKLEEAVEIIKRIKKSYVQK
jgi:molecular chaperone DnaK (HSP70)